MLTLHFAFSLGRVFGWEIEGNGLVFFIEVVVATDDVRFLNHLNLTSTTQVMVHFPRLPQLRLFICLCLDLGTSFCFEKRGNLEFFFFI